MYALKDFEYADQTLCTWKAFVYVESLCSEVFACLSASPAPCRIGAWPRAIKLKHLTLIIFGANNFYLQISRAILIFLALLFSFSF